MMLPGCAQVREVGWYGTCRFKLLMLPLLGQKGVDSEWLHQFPFFSVFSWFLLTCFTFGLFIFFLIYKALLAYNKTNKLK